MRRCGAFRSADFSGLWFHWPLATDHWPLLLVRNHPLHLVKIRSTDQHGIPQLFLALLGLRGQDVAEKRFVPLHLSRPGFLEALGSAFVCF
jgi:hypothetical protein